MGGMKLSAKELRAALAALWQVVKEQCLNGGIQGVPELVAKLQQCTLLTAAGDVRMSWGKVVHRRPLPYVLRALLQTCASSPIAELDISGNDLGDDHAKMLAAVIAGSPSLRHVNVGDHRMSNAGMEAVKIACAKRAVSIKGLLPTPHLGKQFPPAAAAPPPKPPPNDISALQRVVDSRLKQLGLQSAVELEAARAALLNELADGGDEQRGSAASTASTATAQPAAPALPLQRSSKPSSAASAASGGAPCNPSGIATAPARGLPTSPAAVAHPVHYMKVEGRAQEDAPPLHAPSTTSPAVETPSAAQGLVSPPSAPRSTHYTLSASPESLDHIDMPADTHPAVGHAYPSPVGHSPSRPAASPQRTLVPAVHMKGRPQPAGRSATRSGAAANEGPSPPAPGPSVALRSHSGLSQGSQPEYLSDVAVDVSGRHAPPMSGVGRYPSSPRTVPNPHALVARSSPRVTPSRYKAAGQIALTGRSLKDELMENEMLERENTDAEDMYDVEGDIEAGAVKDLSRAKLTSIAHRDLSNVTVLVLKNNALTELAQLPATLTRLDVSRNSLTSLAGLGLCSGLEVLVARRNRITRLGQDLHACCKIHTLLVGYNNIRRVEGIEHLANLRYLDLGHNELATPASVRTLSLNTRVQTLVLKGNPLAHPAGRRRICVSNLPQHADEAGIKQLLSSYGSVDSLYMLPNRTSKDGRKAAFVVFCDQDDTAKRCATGLAQQYPDLDVELKPKKGRLAIANAGPLWTKDVVKDRLAGYGPLETVDVGPYRWEYRSPAEWVLFPEEFWDKLNAAYHRRGTCKIGTVLVKTGIMRAEPQTGGGAACDVRAHREVTVQFSPGHVAAERAKNQLSGSAAYPSDDAALIVRQMPEYQPLVVNLLPNLVDLDRKYIAPGVKFCSTTNPLTRPPFTLQAAAARPGVGELQGKPRDSHAWSRLDRSVADTSLGGADRSRAPTGLEMSTAAAQMVLAGGQLDGNGRENYPPGYAFPGRAGQAVQMIHRAQTRRAKDEHRLRKFGLQPSQQGAIMREVSTAQRSTAASRSRSQGYAHSQTSSAARAAAQFTLSSATDWEKTGVTHRSRSAPSSQHASSSQPRGVGQQQPQPSVSYTSRPLPTAVATPSGDASHLQPMPITVSPIRVADGGEDSALLGEAEEGLLGVDAPAFAALLTPDRATTADPSALSTTTASTVCGQHTPASHQYAQPAARAGPRAAQKPLHTSKNLVPPECKRQRRWVGNGGRHTDATRPARVRSQTTGTRQQAEAPVHQREPPVERPHQLRTNSALGRAAAPPDAPSYMAYSNATATTDASQLSGPVLENQRADGGQERRGRPTQRAADASQNTSRASSANLSRTHSAHSTHSAASVGSNGELRSALRRLSTAVERATRAEKRGVSFVEDADVDEDNNAHDAPAAQRSHSAPTPGVRHAVPLDPVTPRRPPTHPNRSVSPRLHEALQGVEQAAACASTPKPSPGPQQKTPTGRATPLSKGLLSAPRSVRSEPPSPLVSDGLQNLYNQLQALHDELSSDRNGKSLSPSRLLRLITPVKEQAKQVQMRSASPMHMQVAERERVREKEAAERKDVSPKRMRAPPAPPAQAAPPALDPRTMPRDAVLPAGIDAWVKEVLTGLNRAHLALKALIVLGGSAGKEEQLRYKAIIDNCGMLHDTEVPVAVVKYFRLSDQDVQAPAKPEPATKLEALLALLKQLSDTKTCLKYIFALIEQGTDTALHQYIERARASTLVSRDVESFRF